MKNRNQITMGKRNIAEATAFRKALIMISVMLSSLLLSHCYFMFIRNNDAVEFKPLDLTGTRVILLLKGTVCLLAKYVPAEEEGKKGTYKCVRQGRSGYYPAALLFTYRGSWTAMPEYHGVNALREVRRLAGRRDLTSVFDELSRIHGMRRYRIETLESFADYQASQKENIIEIVFHDVDVEHNWSELVSAFTLGIIPGFSRHYPRITMNYYDVSGIKKSFKSRSKVFGERWNHLVFAFWGMGFTRGLQNRKLTDHHIRGLFEELRRYKAAGGVEK